MLRKLVVQVSALIAVATLTGILFTTLGINFFIGFFLGVAVQFGAYYGYVNALNAYVLLRNKKLDNERLREFSRQGLRVTCPCHKRVEDFVPVRLNTQNYYKCTECNKTISVYINAETAVATEPLDGSLQYLNQVLEQGIKDANT